MECNKISISINYLVHNYRICKQCNGSMHKV
jgi:hypothetical protein